MFNGLFTAQGIVTLLLGLAAFAAEVFALVDCVRHRPDAFVAAGKRTKQFWSIVLGIAVAGFVLSRPSREMARRLLHEDAWRTEP